MAGVGTVESDSDKNAEVVIRALTEKLGSKKLLCPLFHNSHWEVQHFFAAVPAFDLFPPPPVPDKSFPLAVLVCNTCGFTFFVNLKTLGVAEEIGLPVLDD